MLHDSQRNSVHLIDWNLIIHRLCKWVKPSKWVGRNLWKKWILSGPFQRWFLGMLWENDLWKRWNLPGRITKRSFLWPRGLLQSIKESFYNNVDESRWAKSPRRTGWVHLHKSSTKLFQVSKEWTDRNGWRLA